MNSNNDKKTINKLKWLISQRAKNNKYNKFEDYFNEPIEIYEEYLTKNEYQIDFDDFKKSISDNLKENIKIIYQVANIDNKIIDKNLDEIKLSDEEIINLIYLRNYYDLFDKYSDVKLLSSKWLNGWYKGGPIYRKYIINEFEKTNSQIRDINEDKEKKKERKKLRDEINEIQLLNEKYKGFITSNLYFQILFISLIHINTIKTYQYNKNRKANTKKNSRICELINNVDKENKFLSSFIKINTKNVKIHKKIDILGLIIIFKSLYDEMIGIIKIYNEHNKQINDEIESYFRDSQTYRLMFLFNFYEIITKINKNFSIDGLTYLQLIVSTKYNDIFLEEKKEISNKYIDGNSKKQFFEIEEIFKQYIHAEENKKDHVIKNVDNSIKNKLKNQLLKFLGKDIMN